MENKLNLDEIEKLPAKERALLKKRHALHCKYEKAVTLYADTTLSTRIIALRCGVTPGALGYYLRRYWRELDLHRHQIPVESEDLQSIKIYSTGKQNRVSHERYKAAVEACDMMKYIDLNISQVARKFGLNGTALANFMRKHYEEILSRRHKIRDRLGINDNIPRGARPSCVQQYTDAVELYRTTEMTIPEIAEKFKVSESGLMQHLRFYHKDVLQQKRAMRKRAKEEKYKKRGGLQGNGRKYEPSAQTINKYAEALTLYKNTVMTLKEIADQTGVTTEGFRFYLHKWHKNLVLDHLGITDESQSPKDLRKARNRTKRTSLKYQDAINSIKQNPRSIAQVANEFNLQPESFRQYLHKYEPELISIVGMGQNEQGKRTMYRSEKKYKKAIELYQTTTEDLKSIATRLGLVYNSIGGYIRRNYPDAIIQHKKLIQEDTKNKNV